MMDIRGRRQTTSGLAVSLSTKCIKKSI